MPLLVPVLDKIMIRTMIAASATSVQATNLTLPSERFLAFAAAPPFLPPRFVPSAAAPLARASEPSALSASESLSKL